MTVWLARHVDAGRWSWTRDEGPGRIWAAGFPTAQDAVADACLDGGEEVEFAEIDPPPAVEWLPRPYGSAALAATDVRGNIIAANFYTAGREFHLQVYEVPEAGDLTGWDVRGVGGRWIAGGEAMSLDAAKAAAVVALVRHVLAEETKS